MDAADLNALALLILAGILAFLVFCWALWAGGIWIDALWQHFRFRRFRKEYIQEHGIELIDVYEMRLASHRVECFGSAAKCTNPLNVLKLVVEAIRKIGTG